MGDHLAFIVNRLLTESTLHAAIESRNKKKEMDGDDEFETLSRQIDVEDLSPKKLVECRICQDEDFDSNMEIPCSCRGSLKYAHRRCVQRWCNEKGDTVCEICHQPFKPGYHAPPPVLYRHIPVNIRRNWQISRRELHEQQYVQTISVDEESLLSSDTDNEPTSRTYIFRFAVYIIFLGLLILRHILPFVVGNDEFVLPLFILAALRIAGILLLVYVTMRAVTGLRRHRHQEEIDNSGSDASDTSSDNEIEQEDQQQPPHSHVIHMS